MPAISKNVTASGSTEILAAPVVGSISVRGYQIIGKLNTAGKVLLQSDTTMIAGTPVETTSSGICCPPTSRSSQPYCKCEPGKALNANLSGAGDVLIHVQYEIV